MLEIFQKYRPQIQKTIEDYLDIQAQTNQSINRWGQEIQDRLRPFICSGKLIRGGLSLLGYQMYSGKDFHPALPLAAAMEFFQSAFLIHDDIMDQDQTRRGKPSIYYQYQLNMQQAGITEDERLGQALGVCAGDISFFWAYDLLSHYECQEIIRTRILSLASREYIKVGLAQMEDVYFGFLEEEVSREEILNVFRYKTARYTFSLPLMLGAILAGAPQEAVDRLAKMGEALGIIFQIKDDELGIYGDSIVTGKPVGSDISDGKKTLFRHFLMQKAEPLEKLKLRSLFGNPHLTPQDIRYVKEMLERYNIQESIQEELDIQAKIAEQEIREARIGDEYRTVLRELLDYSLHRSI